MPRITPRLNAPQPFFVLSSLRLAVGRRPRPLRDRAASRRQQRQGGHWRQVRHDGSHLGLQAGPRGHRGPPATGRSLSRRRWDVFVDSAFGESC